MADTGVDNQELVKAFGRGSLLNIRVDDGAPLEAACRALREHLGRSRQLYAHGDVSVDIGRRLLVVEQQERIRKVIESESGLSVKEFRCEPEVLERERERITNLLALQSATAWEHSRNGHRPKSGPEIDEAEPARNGRSVEAEPEIGVPEPAESDATEQCDEPGQYAVGGIAPGGERYGAPALMVRGTCRAGEVLTFPGNVVVMGNVNPGAQIIAQGDVLVFGALRGTAHAGCEGDASAVIVAMSTASPHLRIADYQWHDDGPRDTSGRRGNDSGAAVIARVENRAIRVSPYLKNHGLDHGGNPNER